jgi:enamine deaminase RidA (YjgF/YER057c/UK114 family)
MTIIEPSGWPRPSGYANGIVADGRIVAIAGQIGWDPRTRTIASHDFVEQARQALQNVASVLTAAGGAPPDVIRLTWYITDRATYLARSSELGAAYRGVFGTHYPAMSVVVVSALLEPAAVVEIEATAVLQR